MDDQPRLLVAAGLVWIDRAHLLLQRRAASAQHGAGYLEFVGGKIERGESPRQGLARELTEEWGPAAEHLIVGRIAEVLHHVYSPPGPEVVLLVYHVDARAWGPQWPSRLVLPEGVSVDAYSATSVPLDDMLMADRVFGAAIKSGAVRCPFA